MVFDKKELIKLLPQLIREDDEIKGAIITALSGVVATKEDIARLIEHSDRRFEAMDKRFEAMDKRIEALQIQIDNNYRNLRSAIDHIGDRSGKGLERAVLKLLQEQNKLKDIEISKIEQISMVDSKGLVFVKGFTTDIDVLMENGKTILIEIKFKIDNRDLNHFFQVAKLYEKLYKKPDELWALSLEIAPKTLATATKFPIKVIYGKIRK